MAKRQVPEKLLSLLKDIGLSEKESLWDCHGTPVVLHKALEKIANSLDALTLWFEEIDKEEWGPRIEWYLSMWKEKYIDEDEK